ncbi:MAG TPA: hypothetical protein VGL91_14315 [Acidobacteriota bacterium]|jgi:hypothetical protein
MKHSVPFQDRPDGHGAVSGSPELPTEVVRAQLQKILASPAFARSERLSRFLRFAVEKALQGEGAQLKEYLLGLEVFDRGPSYDPRIDPIVRVEAARLRSRVKEYYQSEGQADPILIDFGKGSYAPIFHKREQRRVESILASSWTRHFQDWRIIASVASLVLLAVALIWGADLQRRNSRLQQQLDSAEKFRSPDRIFSPLWGSFFNADGQNFVIFGSPMFFSNPGAGLFLRRSTLNDETNLLNNSDFHTLQERFGPLAGPHYDYAEMGDAIALQRLTAFFGKVGCALTALPAHLATWDSIKEGNIIFLGTPRMNHLLRKLPVQQDFEWGRGPEYYIENRNPQPGEEKVYVTSSHRDAVTYAVIASFPGLRPNREILLLTTHSSPGALAAVEYLTRPESVRTMTEKLQLIESGKRKYFQMLLRVSVDNNIPVKIEYVTHHEVAGRQQAGDARQ